MSNPGSESLRVGTRRSALARKQTDWVVARLKDIHPDRNIEVVEIVTTGDRILDSSLRQMPDKGVFVKEIEDRLLAGEIDLAVHSMKDLPTEFPAGLGLGAIPKREDARDALITRHHGGVADLPKGSRIGTGSLRRKAQLLHARPDLEVVEIRGNIDTRLRKGEEELDGVLLAAAGLIRMGWQERIREFLSCETMVPAVGQGALGIEVRDHDVEVKEFLRPFDDSLTAQAVAAERHYLARMGGGCHAPISAYCRIDGDEAEFKAFAANPEGKSVSFAQRHGELSSIISLADELADELSSAISK